MTMICEEVRYDKASRKTIGGEAKTHDGEGEGENNRVL